MEDVAEACALARARQRRRDHRRRPARTRTPRRAGRGARHGTLHRRDRTASHHRGVRRMTTIVRESRETQIRITLTAGTGQLGRSHTGEPFLDHMLVALARYSGIDMTVDGHGRSQASPHRGCRHRARPGDRRVRPGHLRALRRPHRAHGRCARARGARPGRPPLLRGAAAEQACTTTSCAPRRQRQGHAARARAARRTTGTTWWKRPSRRSASRCARRWWNRAPCSAPRASVRLAITD